MKGPEYLLWEVRYKLESIIRILGIDNPQAEYQIQKIIDEIKEYFEDDIFPKEGYFLR